MGITRDYRRKKKDGLLWVWVGFLVTLAVGAVICWAALAVLSPARQSLAIKATHRALAKRGITDVGQELNVEAFGKDTCVVTGRCMHKGLPTVYIGTCKLVNGTWHVNSVQLPIDDAFDKIQESFQTADRLLKEATQ